MLLPFRTLVLLSVLHLLFLASVFDIYFRSPVLTDIHESHKPNYDAPARRLVLMVADGLRADTFFNKSEETPFLHEMGTKHGVMAISHTRVPTESRPGHVAMIAGMYEDPSAITRGWSENPVEFDTLFNQSRLTWSWGSPDILPMFSKAVSGGRMRAEWYSHEEEDLFGAKNLSLLDSWVFDKVDDFFTRASDPNSSLRSDLREDKIVLFLHLLGLDSNGHVNKPHSEEYRANLALVDAGARRVAQLVDSHWRSDDRTAFVFTADHGMTDWGSHGTGMPHETDVPLVAWGAGVRRPKDEEQQNAIEELAQADIAPFMSSLIGVGVPKNSAGRLPAELLSLPSSSLGEASCAVAKQAFEMLATLRKRFDKQLVHRPFSQLDQVKFDEVMKRISRLSQLGKHQEALLMAEALAETSREGVNYYLSYFRVQLFAAVSLTYLGFIAWAVLEVIGNFSPLVTRAPVSQTAKTLINSMTTLGAVLALAATFTQAAPAHFMLYFAAPVVIWRMAALSWCGIVRVPSVKENILSTLLNLLVMLTTVESMVLSFFDRRVLSAAVVAVTFWQVANKAKANSTVKVAYTMLSLSLCAFTFQPTIGEDHNSTLVLISSQIAAGAALSILGVDNVFRSLPSLLLVLYLPLSGFCVFLADVQNAPKMAIHIVSWTIFITGIPIALITKPLGMLRLLHLVLALQSAYTLLSLTYESLFLLCLSGTLATWLEMERAESGVSSDKLVLASDRPKNVVDWRDAFRALLFVFYAVVSFFGTGNIASLNSFDPSSIRCLVSVFNPFLMGGILLGKVLIPFLLVSVCFYLVKTMTRMHPRAFLLTMIVLADCMGLHFFFLVTDKGSWLDIGSSLSRFVIAEATAIFLSVLLALAEFLLSAKLGRR